MQNIKKYFMTLALLLTAVTGAWADESETITTATKGTTVYTGTHFKITASYICDANGIYLFSNNNHGKATIESLNGENITKIEMHMTCGGKNATKTTTTAGQLVATNSSDSENDISVINVNATSVEIGTTVEASDVTDVQIDKFVIYYGTAASSGTAVTVDWNKTSKTGTFTMPGGNVTVSVEYYDLATLATNGVTAPTTYVSAKTEDPLAVVADGAVTGGTLMFAFGTETTYPDLDGEDWQTAIPTAETIDEAGTYYVWYYIKGDDEHSDTDPQRLTLHVQPEPEYTVSMAEGTDDAANWKAGKNDASTTTLPLEGVKKGDKVTVKYDGERKVIGVKAEKVVKIKTFSIQGPSGNVSPGQTITFTIINIQPAEATNQTFEWKLSGAPEGTTIESISDDTKTVTVKAGSSMGPITIKATAKDGSGKNNSQMVWLIP